MYDPHLLIFWHCVALFVPDSQPRNEELKCYLHLEFYPAERVAQFSSVSLALPYENQVIVVYVPHWGGVPSKLF